MRKCSRVHATLDALAIGGLYRTAPKAHYDSDVIMP